MAEKTRYSDEELEEFRQIINEKMALALEEGSTTQSKEEIISMAARQQKFIQGLKAALVRIENKTYGIDRITGELIPKERLRAVPHATLSVQSKMNQKK